MEKFIGVVNAWVWGPPLLIFLVIVGVYLTICTRGVQFRYFGYAHKLAFSRHDDNAKGDISHFEALMTCLAATIGIGSITGVATAISIGGMGAVFWMWVSALFGMATKYAEAILAIKYREVDSNGLMCGGPMYYLEKGLKSKFLGVTFAILASGAAFGIGNLVQANSVAIAMQDMCHVSPNVTGLVLMVLVGIALLGGIKSIGKISSYLVPAMASFYIITGLIVVFARIEFVPAAFKLIFTSAFKGQAAFGGFVGATIMSAIRLGFSRGIFSSEAGLGSSPIAAAAAKTDTPGRQALISMSSVFLTTGIVCTITALAIAVTGVLGVVDSAGNALIGPSLVLKAFDSVIPFGGILVTVALIPFAFSTILGWAYYGEKSMEYLLGVKAVIPYRILFIVMVFPGAALSLNVVWGFANVMNGLMAIPNLIGLFFLAGVVAKETRHFDGIVREERRLKKKR
ncbi:sodium:alanine symporter family protein [Candidatus Aerophobetes bacterium]|uniref:Sodium:alanine symporter family protein n=1 Tax=Aerophobetes bacterium TaxID=2030807 RepID=A0A2A4X865_UNCAE|nr:MAG: sodium:alanine symporter family protein [Candidatus Aerophobetes bacterium]